MYHIRNHETGETSGLIPGSPMGHPQWVYQQLSVANEGELGRLSDHWSVENYRGQGDDEDGVFWIDDD